MTPQEKEDARRLEMARQRERHEFLLRPDREHPHGKPRETRNDPQTAPSNTRQQ